MATRPARLPSIWSVAKHLGLSGTNFLYRAIAVDTRRDRSLKTDLITVQMEEQLSAMLQELAAERAPKAG